MICLVFPYINIRHNLPINLSPLVTVLSVWFECFILQMLDTCHAYQSTIVSTNICQRVDGNGSESPGRKEKRHNSFLIHWACMNKELPIKILIFREEISSSLSQYSSSCIMFHCYEFFYLLRGIPFSATSSWFLFTDSSREYCSLYSNKPLKLVSRCHPHLDGQRKLYKVSQRPLSEEEEDGDGPLPWETL